jgi:hypothetical protein
MIGIYKITNPKGRIYIGQTRNYKKRISYYKYKCHNKQVRLFNSFDKYSFENHIIEFIEECKFEELNIRERYWQDYYDVLSENGLNCVLVETNILPRIYTKEYLLNSKIRNTGKNNPMYGIKGEKHHNSKKVICTLTNKIYNSLTECCEENNLNPKYMSRWLNGSRNNKTTYKYYGE